MSFERKRNIIVFFSFVIITVCNFRNCGAASVDVINGLRDVKINPEKASINDKEPRTKHSTKHKPEDLDGRVILSRNLRTTFDDAKHQTQNAITTAKLAPKPLDMRAPWNVRNTFVAQKSSLDLGGGHHADFKGFEGQSIQGKVYGPSANHNHHSSEWLSMRPLVQCEDELMTLTASGRGYIHLMVDRVDASPISLFQLPPNCGYHLKTTWRDLVMMAPYDGCYVRQENGNYVLPMLWWGSPVKIACPIPPLFAVSVRCSHFGMAVQIHRAEVVGRLRVMEEGEWVSFVSEECAYRVASPPDDLLYFAPFTASCVTVDNGVHLPLQLDSQEVVFSCAQPPPPSMSPDNPEQQHNYIPDSVTTPTTTPYPPPPAREQMSQLPHFPYPTRPGHIPYPGPRRPLPGRYPGQYPMPPTESGYHPYSQRAYPDPPAQGPTPVPTSPPQSPSPGTRPPWVHPLPWDHALSAVFPPYGQFHPGPVPYPGPHLPLPERHPGYYPFYHTRPGQQTDYTEPLTPEPIPVQTSPPQTHSPAIRPARLPPGSHEPSMFYPPHANFRPGQAPYPSLYQLLPGRYPGQYPSYPLGPGSHPGYDPELTPVLTSPPQTPSPPSQEATPSSPPYHPSHIRPGPAARPGLYQPEPEGHPGRYVISPIGPGHHPYRPGNDPDTPTQGPTPVQASPPQPLPPGSWDPALSVFYPPPPHFHPGRVPYPGLYQPHPERPPGQYPVHPVGSGRPPYGPGDFAGPPSPEPIPALASPQTPLSDTQRSALPPVPQHALLSTFHPYQAPYPGHYQPLPGGYPGQHPIYPIGLGHHPDSSGNDPDPVSTSPPQSPSPPSQEATPSSPPYHPPRIQPGPAARPGLYQPEPEGHPGRYVIYPIGPGHRPYRPGNDPETLQQGATPVLTGPLPTLPPVPQPSRLPPGPQDSTMPPVYPPYHPPQQVTCPPYAQTFCGSYSYSVPGSHYQPQDPIPFILTPSPPLDLTPGLPNPRTALPVTSETPEASFLSPSPVPTPPPRRSLSPELGSEPSLHCLAGHMMVSLPSALPDSIQVKDQSKGWVSVSSAPEACQYILQMRKGGGVILYSPLPACHTQPMALDPDRLSFPLRLWDTALRQYSTVELRCPSSQSTVTPSPGTPTHSVQGQTQSPSPSLSQVFCSARHMSVDLPPGPVSGIVVRDIKGNERNLNDAPKHCGYVASKGKDGQITLNLPFKSCHMAVQGGMHRIDVIHTTPHGQTREVHLSCPVSMAASNEDCDLPHEQHLPCGPDPPSREVCLSLGCCYSDEPSSCYYPMDECTTDRHFVFMVPASITDPPLSPGLLASTGDPTCAPQRVTPDYALFKMPLEGCGAHKYEVGQSVIYMVEIIKGIQAVSLNYGTITRDSPLRLLVECRYTPSSMASVGYMVKSPSLGPSIQAHGVFGVQLRIAKDMDYSSYYPQYHRPLQMLLGKPLYLEVRLLNPPDESVVLLVHYCVAYPRSGQAAWVLLYNGCPNPLDPVPQIPFTTLPALNLSQGQTRRFTISTFQFLPSEQAQVDDNEEIYFMCSTEVCSPQDGPCSEGCLGQEWDDRRLRTEDR